MTTTALNADTLQALLGCVDKLIEIARSHGMYEDADGSIRAAVESAEQYATTARRQLASAPERPAALCVIEGGQLQSVLTTGGVDVLVVDYLEDAGDADDNVTDVRYLEDDGTWSETDPAQVHLHGEGVPPPKEVAIVRARIEEFRRSAGKVC